MSQVIGWAPLHGVGGITVNEFFDPPRSTSDVICYISLLYPYLINIVQIEHVHETYIQIMSRLDAYLKLNSHLAEHVKFILSLLIFFKKSMITKDFF